MEVYRGDAKWRFTGEIHSGGLQGRYTVEVYSGDVQWRFTGEMQSGGLKGNCSWLFYRQACSGQLRMEHFYQNV